MTRLALGFVLASLLAVSAKADPSPCLRKKDVTALRETLKRSPGFDDDRVRDLKQSMAFTSICSEQVAEILGAFDTDDGKLKALKLLARPLVDPGNTAAIVAAFSFSDGQSAAAAILSDERRRRRSAPQ